MSRLLDPRPPVPWRPYHRYVAIGDSSTEGLDDPDGQGGFWGWADRLAARLAAAQGGLLYANLGIRGRRSRQIHDEQLGPALEMRPDLVTLFTGTNDVVRRRFDPGAVFSDITAMQGALIQNGAVVLGFTLPDLSGVLPFGLGRRLAPRVAELNDAIREASAATGALCVDFAAHPVASNLRYWSDDRFHANAVGHTMMAEALGQSIGLPGATAPWSGSPPPAPGLSALRRLATDTRWLVVHGGPWILRHARGRSSGDGIRAKRPRLEPLLPDSGATSPGPREAA